MRVNNAYEDRGRLIISAKGKGWLGQKLLGIIMVVSSIFLLLFSIILGFTKGWTEDARNVFLIGFIITCLMLAIFLPMTKYTRAKIYERGIVPHTKPFKYVLKRLEYYIPYDQIEKMEVIDGKYAGEVIKEINVVIHVKGKRFPISIARSDVGSDFYEILKQIARDFKPKRTGYYVDQIDNDE